MSSSTIVTSLRSQHAATLSSHPKFLRKINIGTKCELAVGSFSVNFKFRPIVRVPQMDEPLQSIIRRRRTIWRLGFSRTSFQCIYDYPVYHIGGFWSLSPSSDAPTPLLALVALIGLPLALWFYKCIIMVLFQRKLIYMGYVPTDARTQALTGSLVPRGVECEEVQIHGYKRVRLRGILARRKSEALPPKTVLVYLQGNTGNPLMRLPIFERLLMGPPIPGPSELKPLSLAILAVAPRSYWKSSHHRPTEEGIISDYRHVLSYAVQRFPTSAIVLYGHSLGGAVSVCLTSQLRADDFPSVRGLILENPFASIAAMVKALYPQRWLPYHHLGIFALDRWDALAATQDASHNSLLRKISPSTMLFLSKNDELVPNFMGESLFEASEALCTGPDVLESARRRKVVLRNSLHENAWKERLWSTEMRRYLQDVASRPFS